MKYLHGLVEPGGIFPGRSSVWPRNFETSNNSPANGPNTAPRVSRSEKSKVTASAVVVRAAGGHGDAAVTGVAVVLCACDPSALLVDLALQTGEPGRVGSHDGAKRVGPPGTGLAGRLSAARFLLRSMVRVRE